MKNINDKKAVDTTKKAGMRHDNGMNAIATRVVRLKIARGFRCTSAMGKLLRAFRGKDFSYTSGHLLQVVLNNSREISDLMRYTENCIGHLQPQREISIRLCILSDTEERYLVTERSQKRQSTLLALQMSLCNDVLTVRVSAPNRLWLSLTLL